MSILSQIAIQNRVQVLNLVHLDPKSVVLITQDKDPKLGIQIAEWIHLKSARAAFPIRILDCTQNFIDFEQVILSAHQGGIIFLHYDKIKKENRAFLTQGNQLFNVRFYFVIQKVDSLPALLFDSALVNGATISI